MNTIKWITDGKIGQFMWANVWYKVSIATDRNSISMRTDEPLPLGTGQFTNFVTQLINFMDTYDYP